MFYCTFRGAPDELLAVLNPLFRILTGLDLTPCGVDLPMDLTQLRRIESEQRLNACTKHLDDR